MYGFIDKIKDSEKDVLINWKPVELSEDGGDVVILAGLGNEFSSSFLDRLQFTDFTVWQSSQNAVAVILLRQD